MTDPLNQPATSDTTWTTVNVAEAIPGVPTPLTWTWEWAPMEASCRGTFVDLGALPRAREPLPEVTDDAFIAIFRGRPAVNLDLFRAMGDAIPGGSGDKIEEGFFGSVRSDMASRANLRRYPVVAAKLVPSAIRARRRLLGHVADTDRWWRPATMVTDPARARALLLESQRRYWAIARVHVTASFVAQGIYSQLAALCAAADLPGLEMTLATYEVEEARLVTDLWEVAQGQRSLEKFLADHGYHGPLETELAVPSWRADPHPLTHLITSYRAGDKKPPAELASGRRTAQLDAQNTLQRALDPGRCALARSLLAVAKRYLPLRELGRATFLRAYDTARAAATVLGNDLATDGRLREPEDVFFLTVDELVSATLPADAQDVVDRRRADRLARQQEQLPQLWVGPVEPVTPTANRATELRGIGASPGIAEGPARVIIHPEDADDFEPDDILVCRTTDPSWASLFYLAAGAVIDIGGPMSHGAIVARELGMPCVINTQNGTAVVESGQHIRVDGTAGTVQHVRST